MKLDAARVVLRPRNISEIFDLALRFATAPAAKLYAKLGLLTLLPAWALCVAAHHALGWEWGNVWLLAIALATPIQGVFTVAISRMMFAEEVRLRDVLVHFLRRLPAYLGALLLTRAMIAIACLAAFLLVPPFWMWARCAYVHEACEMARRRLDEQQRGRGGRSVVAAEPRGRRLRAGRRAADRGRPGRVRAAARSSLGHAV